MAYTLTWSDPSKTAIVIANGTFDNSTSLNLSGKGALNWGQGQQTNLIRLLENFSSPAAPATPTRGQFWYNSTALKMNVWNGSAWVSAGGVTFGSTAPLPASLGDLWWDTMAGHQTSGLNVWNGTSWGRIYSSATLSAVAGAEQLITTSQTAIPGSYNVDTTTGSVTLTLPASPSDGTPLTLSDPFGTWPKFNVILTPAGDNTILASTASFKLDVAYGTAQLIFKSGNWSFK